MTSSPKPRISIVGLGFVGLSLAITNAKAGFDTIGVDLDVKKINSLNLGIPYFFEPKIKEILQDTMRQKKIQFTTDLNYAINMSDITFLAVGTARQGNTADIDTSIMLDAAKQVCASLTKKNKKYHLIVIKSSLPPTTTETHILPIFQTLIEDKRADLVVNPEFLSEGSAIEDIMNPHLIVIGSNGGRGKDILDKYYRNFYSNTPEIMHTNIPAAEIIKYANNAFLATKISFINSIAAICQGIPDVDVVTIARALGRDPRIGPEFLGAGPGFGGSCLPKDLVGLINISKNMNVPPNLFEAVKDVNERQFTTIIDMMSKRNILEKSKTVAILGVAFKGGTDDIRDSISLKLVRTILEHKMTVRVHDPMALKNFEQVFGSKISYHTSIEECLKGSACCVILTDTDAYRDLKQQDLLRWMDDCNIIDARRVLNPKEFEDTHYMAIGRGI